MERVEDNLIGITERADPTVNLGWRKWVEGGNPAILITKNPKQLYSMLGREDNVIVHCSVTLMGGSVVEPKIPSPEESMYFYHKMCGLLGKKRVVLRIDPIVDGVELKALKLLKSEAEGRVRISFLDLYPHSRKRMEEAGLVVDRKTFHMLLVKRYEIWQKLGKPEVCGEPGLLSVGCVSILDCEVLDVKPKLERKGQRDSCSCLANKVELCKWPPKCSYGCLYCYWK